MSKKKLNCQRTRGNVLSHVEMCVRHERETFFEMIDVRIGSVTGNI